MDTEPLSVSDVIKMVTLLLLGAFAIFIIFSGVHELSVHPIKNGTEKCFAHVCIGEVDYGTKEPPKPF